jgi:hypothetical protein
MKYRARMDVWDVVIKAVILAAVLAALTVDFPDRRPRGGAAEGWVSLKDGVAVTVDSGGTGGR